MTSLSTATMPSAGAWLSAKSISPRESGMAIAEKPILTGSFAVSFTNASAARLS